MKKINWTAIVVFALVALVVFQLVTYLLSGWGYRGWGMMGPGGMMGWGYSPFGWIGMGLGMLFLWLIPIGVLALIIYGVVALARGTGNNIPATSSTTPCPHCGKGMQANWKNCPYCGIALKG